MLPSSSQLPLLIAASRARSWEQVLDVYTRCCRHLRGIYTPTAAELVDGVQRMPHSWATSLFYYDVVKGACAMQRPSSTIVLATLLQHKRYSNLHAMKRLLDDDVDTHSTRGAKSLLLLAGSVGMWDKAMRILQAHPSMARNAADRRVVVYALIGSGRWQQALAAARAPPRVELSTAMVKPIVRHLTRIGEHERALRLAARALAGGYAFDMRLFSALAAALRQRGQWQLALQVAESLQLMTPTRSEAQRQVALYNDLIDCLYAADVHAGFTTRQIVDDVSQRLYLYQSTPASQQLQQAAPPVPLALLQRRQQQQQQQQSQPSSSPSRPFRLYNEAEVQRQFRAQLLTFNSIYAKIIYLARWHTRPLHLIVDAALQNNTALLVVDTNFLLQCIAKDHALERFYDSMRAQYPELRAYDMATIVVPFTVVRELYKTIWGVRMRVTHAGKMLMWGRLQAFFTQPSVYALALSAEYATTTYTPLTRMAYDKVPENGLHNMSNDPDLHVLNVCMSLQHTLRFREVAAQQGAALVPEGTVLFAFVKYHVRRYLDEVKGSAAPRLLLCTLDRRLARTATHAGVNSYPRFPDVLQ